MKINPIIFILIILIELFCNLNKCHVNAQSLNTDKPKISFTFDDGSVDDMPGYKLEEWNQMLLDNLQKFELSSILFSMGKNKESERGKYILSSWNDVGHKIANHTYSHSNFNSKKITLEDFESELIKNDSIINIYSNYYKYFRFPYLKEGNTKEKIEGFRSFMDANGYRNGHVTIDASDWYVNGRLLKRLQSDTSADVSAFRDFYIKHLYSRALFYDSLAYQLTGRKISHVILLHHNLAAALFLDDLIQFFKDNGWEIMNAEEAYSDDIYNSFPDNIPAGESLIWALAKQSGKFESVLRYPAEDGEYEKDEMDKLGL
ncbi:MAG TPA: polysaccharide deacetylase family protein [Ignavibacteria bacterium]|nr:polysaccharide deacetylase family protein [Ignavibacteria bacterium]